MSGSKTDPRLATVQPVFKYYHFLYHIFAIFIMLQFEKLQLKSIPKVLSYTPPPPPPTHTHTHTERVTRKRRPWERGNRNSFIGSC